MSFGFSKAEVDVWRLIKSRKDKQVIIFAAASVNQGGNIDRAFPAIWDRTIGVHATDGDGNKYGRNPDPIKGRLNFSTLGEGIKSQWNDKPCYLSGTSFSTAVASGLAANILRFVDAAAQNGELDSIYRDTAFSESGMEAIFKSLSGERDGYNFVIPWRTDWWDLSGTTTTEHICEKLETILRGY